MYSVPGWTPWTWAWTLDVGVVGDGDVAVGGAKIAFSGWHCLAVSRPEAAQEGARRAAAPPFPAFMSLA